MTQITSGVRSILSSPLVYDFFQNLLGAKTVRQEFVHEFIRPFSGQVILDVGCGTAEILSYISDNIEYFGYDLSTEYIEYAKDKYGGRGTFRNTFFDSAAASILPKADCVIAVGLLHHMEDGEVKVLFKDIANVLTERGRFIALDPCFEKGQNPFAKALISMDRGQNVRTKKCYKELATGIFPSVKSSVRHRVWVPYTHHYLECTK